MKAKVADYVALLRGINVGGKNIIPMTELKKAFEQIGFGDVSTYIQSGNVIFSARKMSSVKLAAQIETALSKRFGYESTVVVVSHDELKRAVEAAPKGFGAKPDRYKYDVVFLKPPLTGAIAMKDVKTKPGVDEAFAGKSVLYFSRLTEKLVQSYMSRITQLPAYKQMTIRNWNTTTKLLALLDQRRGASVKQLV